MTTALSLAEKSREAMPRVSASLRCRAVPAELADAAERTRAHLARARAAAGAGGGRARRRARPSRRGCRPTARASISPTLLASMDGGGVTRTCAFPFQSPPGSGYAAANAEVLAAAAASGGRVVAVLPQRAGRALPRRADLGARRGRARHQAAHEPARVRLLAPRARRRLRAGRRAARADPLPHGPRRAAARARSRAACSSATRARRSCSPTARSPTCTRSARCAIRTSASTRRSGTRSTCAPCSPRPRPSRCCTAPTRPTTRRSGRRPSSSCSSRAAGASEAQRRDVAARSAERLLAGEPCARLSEPLGAAARRCPPARACARTSTSSWPCRWSGSRCPTASACSRSRARRSATPRMSAREAALELIALAERTWPLRARARRPQRDPDGLVAHVPADRARRRARDGRLRIVAEVRELHRRSEAQHAPARADRQPLAGRVLAR